MIGAVALIVKFTETRSSGSPANRSTMSSAVSIATPTRPTSGRADGMAGVVAELRRQVERDGQRRLPAFQQEVEPFVRLLRRPEPGELAHRPQPARGTSWGTDHA